ncbi:MAG TPA: type IV pilus twitching motility protein PilT [Solirubrobacteraceae bacterium]
MLDIDDALRTLVASGGSDLHLKVPSRPLMRVDGSLQALENLDELRPADTEAAVHHMLTDPVKLKEFADEHEVDFAYSIPGLARFRVNAFHQRGSISLVVRAIPIAIRTVSELNLPPVINDLADEERGIVLLTGTTGSGKSTTLAAMVDHINSTKSRHIVTIEDPIEFLHTDKRSAINQREVGMDTATFNTALRRVLRQDPDVILIGEMRDAESVHAALSAAETGHLVFSTVHTVDAPETINRIIDFFPPHMHQQVRAMLAGTLKGAVSQRLVPTAEGNGRVAVCEVLRMTGRVRDMIMNPEETGRLTEVIADGGYYGMQTFDQALFTHLKAGRITMEQALEYASIPHDFKLLVAADGRRGTTMDDLAEHEQRRADTVGAPAASALR